MLASGCSVNAVTSGGQRRLAGARVFWSAGSHPYGLTYNTVGTAQWSGDDAAKHRGLMREPGRLWLRRDKSRGLSKQFGLRPTYGVICTGHLRNHC